MNVEFHYDFGSPNAYHSHQVIKGIEARTGVAFNYVPILLGGVHKLTNNQSPMAAFGNVKGKLDYQRRETQRFMKWNGIDKFIFNSNFPIMTIAINIYERSGLTETEVLIEDALNQGLLQSAMLIALGVVILELRRLNQIFAGEPEKDA